MNKEKKFKEEYRKGGVSGKSSLSKDYRYNRIHHQEGDLYDGSIKGKVYNLFRGGIKLPFNPKRLQGLDGLIILPDYSPNKGLPTGSVAVFDGRKHQINPEYIGQDVGCGMLLARFPEPIENIEDVTNQVASEIILKKTKIGQLGGGNHFVTFYTAVGDSKDYPKGTNFVLIHSGSGKAGIDFYKKKLSGKKYLEEQKSVIRFARINREIILDIINEKTGQDAIKLFDKPHNFVERALDDKIVYRKGVVKVFDDDLSIIPSSMGGNAGIVKVKHNIHSLFYSLPHASGRKIPRSEARKREFYLDGFPEGIYVPYFIYPENLNSELPQNYRTLEETLEKIEPFVSLEAILKPISSIMK